MKSAKDWDQPESGRRRLEESIGSCDGVSGGKWHGMAWRLDFEMEISIPCLSSLYTN
jgi:hypothetical protein